MKIGIDARLWNESGVGRYTRNLVQQLAVLDKRNEYSLFVLSKNKQEIKDQISRPKDDRPLAEKFKVIETDFRWHSLEEQIRFLQLLNKENLDLVHFPYFSIPIFYNKPFVATIHDLIIDHFPTGQASTLSFPVYKMKLSAYKFIISKAAKKAKKIIAVSNATKREIIEHLAVPQDKIIVIYEGVNQELISNLIHSTSLRLRGRSDSRSSGQVSKPKLKAQSYLLYVGNAYPHKNLIRMLEAFVNFKFQISNFKLIMVGREDYFYKKLKEKVRSMNLEKSVEFRYNVDDLELAELYRNAKALILPSLMEGFGLPALEAMANKCLVLCSDIPSFREICQDSAIYFNPFSKDDIKEKMELACLDGSKHFNGNIEKAFKRSEMFSWQKMAKETLRIYESCIGL